MTKKLVSFVPSSENQTEEEAFFDFATGYFNDHAGYFGGAIASQDRQHFRLRDRRTGKLLLEARKVSPEFWGDMLAKFMVYQIVPEHPRRRPIDRDIVAAAAERWQRNKNIRIVAKQRFRRNNKAERNTQNAINAALAERMRFRMKVENAAHWVNEQLGLCPADDQVRFAGRSTDKYSVRSRLHDSVVYDDRDMFTLYTWRRGLPVPLRDGHVIRRNLHGYSPKKRVPNYPRRIPKNG